MSPFAPAACAAASRPGRLAALLVALTLAACASKPPAPPRAVRPGPVARATPPPARDAATPPAAVPAPAPAPAAAPAASPPNATPQRDGAEPNPPPDLERVPDAEPTLEPIRPGGPNKPYEVAGQSYAPITKDAPFVERGIASWYGRKFHGRKTASGELYNMYAMTAAHKTLPIPSYARVRNPANGSEVIVRVNDRGPFVAGRIVDLSYTAALKLGLLRGIGPVEVERITFDDIRTGAWRRDAATSVAAAATPATPEAAAATTLPEPAAPPAAPEPAVANATPAATAGDEPRTTAQRANTAPARGFWVQLGAFKERNGAEDFHRRVSTTHDWLAPMLAVFADLPLFRLQAGPYPSRDEARSAAEQIRAALQLVPVILERR